MLGFLRYVRGRLRRNRQRADPLFPPALWNTNETTLAGLPRTTNVVEGWHNRFNTIVGKCHANLFEFILAMRSEQGSTERIREQHRNGRRVAVPIRRYVNINARIRDVVNDYQNRPIIDYLKAIAHNLNF